MRKSKGIKVGTGAMILFFLLTGVVTGETHWNFQAVDSVGNTTYFTPEVVTLEGIILNSPEEMLDPTPGAPVFMGGQWQMFIQGEEKTDDPCYHAGTALWMGQNYGNLPWVQPDGSYTDQEWVAELCRLNHNPDNGYLFTPGDRVCVTGYYSFYNGKNNINEGHSKDPTYDFTIELIEPGVGLPQPELVMLDDLKDEYDIFIFDQNRETGCEYYQGRLVRLNDVSFTTDPNQWDAGATLEITDGTKTFPVKLGIGSGIYPGSNNLTDTFDVVGIMDQEDDTGDNTYKKGYRIWVTNYDGNGLVLRDRGYRRGNLPGDIDGDGRVDLLDFAMITADWLLTTPGISDCN
ncbi:MAG: hypothetical protein KAJ52_05745 [Sedimentisphaerales bacterium]|nr:hypothetical protein [Sedimentisphaerales bacterium]